MKPTLMDGKAPAPPSKNVPAGEAVRELADLLSRVQYAGERITITRHGKPVAQLVPVAA